ncbi:unnamed protein product [Natator depressus]
MSSWGPLGPVRGRSAPPPPPRPAAPSHPKKQLLQQEPPPVTWPKFHADSLPPGGELGIRVQCREQPTRPRAPLEPCPGLSPFPAYGAQPREAIPDPGAEMLSCGLLTSSKEPVPLHRSSVSVLIRGFVADVGSQLLCRKEEPGPMEAVFKFPVNTEVAVDAFQARLRGAWIQAQLQEKRQAQELYGDALAGGQSSFLLQQEGAGGDVFSCSLGNLPPGEEAMLTLSCTCELPLEHDGAARHVLPTVLHPRYTPHRWDGENITQEVPRVLQGELPYTLSRSAMLQSPHGIDHVVSNCPLTPLSYTAGNLTTAQGCLMGDPAVMMTLLPRVPEAVPAQSQPGSSSSCWAAPAARPAPRTQRPETLVLPVKSLPLSCYFKIYGFGSEFESFYPQSVENTQQTKAESLQRLQLLQANLGGTEILEPLRAIYRSPCRDEHPPQFKPAVRVYGRGGREHPGHHRRGATSPGNPQQVLLFRHQRRGHLIKGIARAVGGIAEFITGQDHVQPKVLQSLKRALQPAVTGISLSWDLPPGIQAELLQWDLEVIFAGQRCLVYAQLRGQPQPPDIPMGGITLQYRIQDQTYKETLQFSLQPQDGDRLPVHRLAAKSLLLELEGAVGAGSEGDGRWALEASLSSGVVCSLTAYVGVDMERGQLVQGPLVRRDVPLAERAPEESPLLRLVSLQNADVSWNLDPRLAAVLRDVTPSIWATVLAMVWLHGQAMGQCDESSCWRPRLWAGCGTEQPLAPTPEVAALTSPSMSHPVST